MNIDLLMTPSEVVEYAFAPGAYVKEGTITESHILAAQRRFLQPVLGPDLLKAVARGDYEMLREEFIAPTLGIFSRLEAQLDAYPPTKCEFLRAKLFLSTLSDYLNTNQELYPEYNTAENILNRCEIVGGMVLS